MNHTGFLARATLGASVAISLLYTTVISAAEPKPQAHVRYDALKREDFNRRAAENYLPLFWRNDANGNGAIDPTELAVLWGFPQSDLHAWLGSDGAFTARFAEAFAQMQSAAVSAQAVRDSKRHELILQELAQGRPTLVQTDLSSALPGEVDMVKHLMRAAISVERLYARQKGVFGMEQQIPAADAPSRMVFARNQSPFCAAPKTENDPACNALPVTPKHIVGLYPADIQADPNFCDALAKAPNAKQLMEHFEVVVTGDQPGTFKTVPYTQAYKSDMDAIADELEAAESKLDRDEGALRTYLRAAARSFRTNDWEPANEAWVAMNAENSKWYVRVAPDEVYYEPCAWKAGFALQLAHINPDSLAWQKKLDPLKEEMEGTLAAMAGPPYQARKVGFKLPDFIDVVLNAGDQRAPHGATIGQSLPNWGPVAEHGGRTVAMTNLYTDPDSQRQLAASMSQIFCKKTNAKATTTGKETLIGSLLHEAAHNLGPAHDYRVDGKRDAEAFGGPLASTLEELKAQTSSMFLTDWLTSKNIFTTKERDEIQLRNIAWQFGHISRGMYNPDGSPKNYSQLAAIQLGSFVAAGAVNWRDNEKAANGADQGCLEIDFAKLPAAVQALETRVLKIKGSADKADAEKLKAQFVDAKDNYAKIKDTITARWLRAPKATFVYSITLPPEK